MRPHSPKDRQVLCKPGRPSHKFTQNFVATARKLDYLQRSFPRLFWGEQPPFTSIGRGGRYFFDDEARKNDEGRMTKRGFVAIRRLSFVINSAFVIRASSFHVELGTSLLAHGVDAGRAY